MEPRTIGYEIIVHGADVHSFLETGAHASAHWQYVIVGAGYSAYDAYGDACRQLLDCYSDAQLLCLPLAHPLCQASDHLPAHAPEHLSFFVLLRFNLPYA